jgi:hypothetical protein
LIRQGRGFDPRIDHYLFAFVSMVALVESWGVKVDFLAKGRI